MKLDRDFNITPNPQEILDKWNKATLAEKARYFAVAGDPNSLRSLIEKGKARLSELGKRRAMATALRINSIIGHQNIVRDPSRPLPNQDLADSLIAKVMAEGV